MEKILGNAFGNTTFMTEFTLMRENRLLVVEGEEVKYVFKLPDNQTIDDENIRKSNLNALLKPETNSCMPLEDGKKYPFAHLGDPITKERHSACCEERSPLNDEDICNDSSFIDYEEEILGASQKTEMRNIAGDEKLFSPKVFENKPENSVCMLLDDGGQLAAAVTKEMHGACGEDGSFFYDESNRNDSVSIENEERLYDVEEIPTVNKETSISNIEEEQKFVSSKVFENVKSYLIRHSINVNDDGNIVDQIFDRDAEVGGNPELEWNGIRGENNSSEREYHNKTCADSYLNKSNCEGDGINSMASETPNVSCELIDPKQILALRQNTLRKDECTTKRRSRKYQAERYAELQSIKTENRYSCLVTDDIKKKTECRNEKIKSHDERRKSVIKKACTVTKVPTGNITTSKHKPDTQDNKSCSKHKPDAQDNKFSSKHKPDAQVNKSSSKHKPDAHDNKSSSKPKPDAQDNKSSSKHKPDAQDNKSSSKHKPDAQDNKSSSKHKPDAQDNKTSTHKPDAQDNKFSSGYAVSSKGFLHGTLRGQYGKQCFFFVLVLMVAVCYGDSIGLSSVDPIVFGHTVILRCDLYNQTTLNHLAWLRRDNGEVLANGNMSTNQGKFQSEIQYMGNQLSYQLKILRFNESDVDPFYRCTYGFDALFFNLSINEENFRYFPLETEITKEIEMTNGSLNISVILQRVYPIPRCEIYIEEMSLYTDLNTTTECRHPFYMARLTFVSTTLNNICSLTIRIRCRIGNATRDMLTERLQSCKMMEHDSHHVIVVIVLTVIAIVIAGIGAYISVRKLRGKTTSVARVSRLTSDLSIVAANQLNKREEESLMTDAIT